MFGTKNRDQIYSFSAREKINRPVAVRIKARLVGDQSYSFAPQGREFLRFQDVNACLRMIASFAAIVSRIRLERARRFFFGTQRKNKKRSGD